MIKYNDVKIGDFVNADYEGQVSLGEVIKLNGNEKQVCVHITDVQEFWFDTQHLHAIPLTEEALFNLNFTKEPNADGSVKYKKGSFRLVTPTPDDFSHLEMWYREDKRHNPNVHFVHQLQNQYLDMTKIHLTRELV
jgi:hypothetical protein